MKFLLSILFIITTVFFLRPQSILAASLGTCTGSTGQGVCTTSAPSASQVIFYQDTVPATQCGINATKANAARGSAVYCCTSGAAQYATCGSHGQNVCNTTCATANRSYTDYAAKTQCGINATKAGLARGTVVYCMCDKTKQTCPTPTTTPSASPSPTGSPLLGDVNHDGKVDVVDYSLIIGCYGDKFGTSSCVAGKAADLNGDGVVDGIDYNIWLRVFIGVEK